LEIQTIQNEFCDILSLISSSDDPTRQLLFVKLQNYLSNFVDIHFRFKSFNFSIRENQSIESTISNIPQITISSSFDRHEEILDIDKSWKFANIIHTRFHMSLIASNKDEIVCYNNQNSFLHFILITGQFLGNIKWNYKSIIDILW
jgi:hypothetical protein